MAFLLRVAAISALAVVAILAIGLGQGTGIATLWAMGLIGMHAKVSACCILALAGRNIVARRA